MTFEEAIRLATRWHEQNLTIQSTTLLIRDIEGRTKRDAIARVRAACTGCLGIGPDGQCSYCDWAIAAIQESDDAEA